MLAPAERPKFIIQTGDCRTILKTYPDKSVHCCVTSPPYFGLRDYGVVGQIGLEPTPEEFVAELVEVFREVRRVLRDDGTFWLNLGDSYAGSGKGGNPEEGKQATNRGSQSIGVLYGTGKTARENAVTNVTRKTFDGVKAKDLIGTPWMVAFALRSDGWYLRQDIIWHKPNPMPESIRDRCTKAHEYIFLLSKSGRYFYDADAISEARTQDESRPTFRGGAYVNNSTFDNAEGGKSTVTGNVRRAKDDATEARPPSSRPHNLSKFEADNGRVYGSRNKRSVWTVAPKPFKEAHFATFPPALIEPCILAGCPVGGIVLDPFGGAGTTGLVALKHGRRALLIELNPKYAEMADRRIRGGA